MMYSLLVPLYVLYFWGISIGFNAILSLIFILLFFKSSNIKNIPFKEISPFIFLYVSQAFLIFTHFSDEPLAYQFNLFRIDFTSLCLPLAIISISTWKIGNAIVFEKAMYVVISIIVIYGLSLMFTPGENAYIDQIALIVGNEETDQTAVLDEGIRIFGYISSCFQNVTQLGCFIIYTLIFLAGDLIKKKRIKYALPLSIGIIILAVFCGSRSTLLGLIGSLSFYTFISGKKRNAILLFIVLIILYNLVIFFFPDYASYVDSISTGSATGSSIEMRMKQLEGCFDSISQNPITGNGYGWCHWYRHEIGRHPIMLSFESILIMILCNNGIAGLLIWIIFAYLYVIQVRKLFSENNETYYLLITLLASYFIYSLFTGDYGCMSQFIIFYSVLIVREKYYQNRLNSSLY